MYYAHTPGDVGNEHIRIQDTKLKYDVLQAHLPCHRVEPVVPAVERHADGGDDVPALIAGVLQCVLDVVHAVGRPGVDELRGDPRRPLPAPVQPGHLLMIVKRRNAQAWSHSLNSNLA